MLAGFDKFNEVMRNHRLNTLGTIIRKPNGCGVAST